MAERSYNGRELLTGQNADFETTPGGVATTADGKWVDGTAGGAADNSAGYNVRFNRSGTAEALFDSTESISGSTSLKISTKAVSSYAEARLLATTYGTLPTEGVALKPLTTYTMSYWMKTNYVSGDATNSARCVFIEADAAGLNNGGGGAGDYVKTTTDWTKYTITFTTKRNTVRGHFEFRIYGHQGTATLIMDAWFDNITLTEVLPVRTTATSRTTATNRVAVRDMGTALRFGANTSDQVAIENSAGQVWAGDTSLTVALWCMPTAFGDYYAFAHPDSAGSNRTYILTNSSGSLLINTGSTGPTFAGFFTRNKWHHVVLVKDRENSLYTVYGNGVALQASAAYTPGTAANIDIFIGQQSGAATKAWVGLIDEPRIWNRALSAQEIHDMHFNDIIPTDGFVDGWLFDETSGLTALGINGNDGTITGATYTLDVPLKLRGTV